MDLYVSKQLELLAEEHSAEIHESYIESCSISLDKLKSKGLCISKLVIFSVKTGLFGRTIASFSPRSSSTHLPYKVFTSGDIVRVDQAPNKQLGEVHGVVTALSDSQISVAFEGTEMRDELDRLNFNHVPVTLLKVANEVTYRRLKCALADLKKFSTKTSGHLIDVIFGWAEPTAYNSTTDLSFVNQNLNSCQQKAVEFAVQQRELAIVHGPPGTGKTTTVVEIIAQFFKRGQKVLACAPSNVAVDNLVEKLTALQIQSDAKKRKIRMVRVGHPARIHKRELHEVCLDARVASSDAAAIVRDVRRDIDEVNAKLLRCHDKGSRQKLRIERKSLYSELAEREKKALREILSSADVVLATNVGAHSKGPLQHLKGDHFDVVIIDECGQALEASCWIPLMRAPKCVLAGDHLQLPPTIVSRKAAENGLALTLLERLVGLHGELVVRMLTEQYRMNRTIMQWSSDQLYDGKLSANSSVANHLLRDLAGVEDTEETSSHMFMVDTAGCEMTESESEDSVSKANEGEAKIVYHHVVCLCKAGVNSKDIAVISPYNLQVDILRQMLHSEYPKLEIKSVDGFQGREKEAVVLSLVRSNKQREVGFLADKRRLNVAVTRARRHIALICDSETVSSHEFLRSLVDYVREHGEVRSGFEYESDLSIEASGRLPCFDHLRSVKPPEVAKEKQPQAPQPKTKSTKSAVRFSSKKPEQAEEPAADLKAKYQDILRQFMEVSKPATPVVTARTRLDVDRGSRRKDETDTDGLTSSLSTEIEALRITYSPSERKLLFPPSLTSSERKAVHEIGDALGLLHASVGEGANRRVVVALATDLVTKTIGEESRDESATHGRKGDSARDDAMAKAEECTSRPTGGDCSADEKTASTPAQRAASPPDHEPVRTPPTVKEHEATIDDAPAARATCPVCSKVLPTDNLQMHLMHCERVTRMKSRVQGAGTATCGSATSKNCQGTKKKSTSKSKRKQKAVEENDVDSLLDAAVAANRACFYGSCTASVATIGQTCTVCRNMFCLTHCLPEVHGCGRGASHQARQQIIRNGFLSSGSASPKPTPEKRAALKSKLSAKVKQMEDSRRVSNTNKKKS